MTDPKWTSEPPTEPGWYWLDDAFGWRHVVEVEVVVEAGSLNPSRAFYWDATDRTEPPETWPTSMPSGTSGGLTPRWAGPITPPEDRP